MGAIKLEKAKVIEVATIAGNVLVTFSDGRIAMLDAYEIYLESTEPPPDPDAE
jgi:hypothetical protein